MLVEGECRSNGTFLTNVVFLFCLTGVSPYFLFPRSG
jgi:hypothetical protein